MLQRQDLVAQAQVALIARDHRRAAAQLVDADHGLLVLAASAAQTSSIWGAVSVRRSGVHCDLASLKRVYSAPLASGLHAARFVCISCHGSPQPFCVRSSWPTHTLPLPCPVAHEQCCWNTEYQVLARSNMPLNTVLDCRYGGYEPQPSKMSGPGRAGRSRRSGGREQGSRVGLAWGNRPRCIATTAAVNTALMHILGLGWGWGAAAAHRDLEAAARKGTVQHRARGGGMGGWEVGSGVSHGTQHGIRGKHMDERRGQVALTPPTVLHGHCPLHGQHTSPSVGRRTQPRRVERGRDQREGHISRV